MPVGIAPTAVVSYTPFSPLPLARRYIFCCTIHAEAFSAAAPSFQTEFRPVVSGLSSRRTERMPAPQSSKKKLSQKRRKAQANSHRNTPRERKKKRRPPAFGKGRRRFPPPPRPFKRSSALWCPDFPLGEPSECLLRSLRKKSSHKNGAKRKQIRIETRRANAKKNAARRRSARGGVRRKSRADAKISAQTSQSPPCCRAISAG